MWFAGDGRLAPQVAATGATRAMEDKDSMVTSSALSMRRRRTAMIGGMNPLGRQ
jgi:hypothetical protein